MNEERFALKEGINNSFDDFIKPHEEEIKERVSTWRLVLVGLWTFGINFGFNAEFVLATPLYESLGLTQLEISFAWLSGPLAGLFFQPIIGYFSDKSTSRFGRRRPYILLGWMISVVGFICFANPQLLAELLDQPDNNTIKIVFAIISQWILNIGLNIVQGPGWALMMDLAGSDQKRGNAVVASLTALSGVLTNLLGFVDLVKFLPFFQDNSHALFYIGVVVICICIPSTLFFGRERPYSPPPPSLSLSSSSPPSSLFSEMMKKNKEALIILIIVTFFTMSSISPYQFYFTDYFGQSVYGGDPQAPVGSEDYNNYQEGVRMGALGFAIMQAVNFSYAISLPTLIRFFGTKKMYFIGMVVGGVVFCSPLIPAVNQPIPAEIIFSFVGITFATSNIIPYSIMGDIAHENNSGMGIAIVNVVQVCGQMFANFTSTLTSTLTENTAYCLAVGGLYAFIASGLVWFLRLRPSK